MEQTSRRQFLKTTAAGAAAAGVVGFPQVSRGAGKLALGLWDHWVPGATAVIKKYGTYNENATYLNRQGGKWVTLPSPIGSHTYPLETRMDLWKKHAGIADPAIFPAAAEERERQQ